MPRKTAIELIREHNQNPKLCLECKSPIFAREGKSPRDEKRRKFCNSSCSAFYNGKATAEMRAKPRECADCRGVYRHSSTYRKRVCRKCFQFRQEAILPKMKSEVPISGLRSHAKKLTLQRVQSCSSCGYSKHVEACHIKAVRNFPPTATVGEINAPSNLILLCPNCHWELDHLESKTFPFHHFLSLL